MLFELLLQLSSIVLALGTPLALWYRFVWGSKSQICFRQLSDPRERKWSYGRQDDTEYWSNYIHVIAINRGWWTGILWEIELQEVSFDDGTTVTDESSETINTAIDVYSDGKSERLDLENPHQRKEQNIPDRGVAQIKLVPFLKTEGNLADDAEQSKEAEFLFEATIQDNKRTDSVEFRVTKDVSDVKFNDSDCSAED